MSAWRVSLDIPAWPAEAPYHVRALRPVLSVSRGDDEPQVQIWLQIGENPREDRWIVNRPDQRAEAEIHAYNPGPDQPRFKRPKGWEMTRGRSDPRDTPGAAVARAVELLAEHVPAHDLVSIRDFLGRLLPPFDSASRSYALKYRPPKEK